jgi:D-alanyl-D-alanine carboxypeptidase/D-alanyl-D-alanine-endopeptidase (penicillin-binding protein 4)
MKFAGSAATGKPIKSMAFLCLFLSIPARMNQKLAKAQAVLPISHPRQVVSETSPQVGKLDVPICPAQLGSAIDAIANRPEFQRSRWGVLLQTLSPASNQTLYARDAQRYFLPASNAKLLTTAAALHKLGPQFRIRTAGYGINSGPRLPALRIVGHGDPSLTDIQLKNLAQQLSHRGIRQIGQLIGDDHYFRGPTINPSWEVADVQSGDGTPVNSLILNQNILELKLSPQALGQPLQVEWSEPMAANPWQIENTSRTVRSAEPEFVDVRRDLEKPIVRIAGQLNVGAEPDLEVVPLLDPAEYFLQHFRQALAANQISVRQTFLAPASPTQKEPEELVAVESPPLSNLVREANQESNNLYAEALLRTLGATRPSSATDANSTAEIGLEVVKATLTSLGVDPKSYVQVDGSGLSRHNLVSPEALVQTLKVMAQSPEAEAYQTSLPIAGISGTLQNRFQQTQAQGILQAKTGTLRGVAALSGYLNSPDFLPLVFSILVNGSDQSGSQLRQAIDEMVLLLTRLRSC